MDISVFISELLFEHDCVIVPGFGGFICNYRPAEIHPVLHIVNPPSKSVSFNVNLSSNDGLLVSYIAKTGNLSFDYAQNLVENWVDSSNTLLRRNETIILKKVGRIFSDIEGNVQFAPDESINYLKASFALKPLTAPPVLRGKEVDFTEKFAHETKKHIIQQTGAWRIAASIMLLVGIGSLIAMMWMGVEIKPLGLNEASVFSFITHLSNNHEGALRPIPMIIENTTKAEEPKAVPAAAAPSSTTVTKVNTENNTAKGDAHGYYIIIGAFSEIRNAEKLKGELLKKYPENAIFCERSGGLTRVGYSAGNNERNAASQLQSAKAENAGCWLLKK